MKIIFKLEKMILRSELTVIQEENMARRYNTKQQEMLSAYLMSLEGKHVSAQDISDYFRSQGEKIGVTTIYRRLEKLIDEGKVQKFITGAGEPACFQYVTCENHHEHFHLKCSGCGKLVHLECRLTEDLLQHVSDEHGFAIDSTKTVLYGTCKSCLKVG